MAQRKKGSHFLLKKKKRKKKKTAYQCKKKKESTKKNLELLATVFFLAFAFVLLKHTLGDILPLEVKQQLPEEMTNYAADEEKILEAEEGPCGRPEIIQDFIVKNPYSRSGISLDKVQGVVVHYVGNAGTTAEENRNYFENLKDTHLTKASSHFIIGLDGEIVQCIPLDEISYASNQRNSDTISIECCHEKNNGKFNKKTYASLVQLVAWLCHTYGLSSSDVIRHYDVTGKMCPKYFVKHEDAWEKFLLKIQKRLDKN